MEFQILNANIKTNYDFLNKNSVEIIKDVISKKTEIEDQLGQRNLIVRGSVNQSGPTLAKVPFYAFRRSMSDIYWTTVLFDVVLKKVYLSIQHKTDGFSSGERNAMTKYAGELIRKNIDKKFEGPNSRLFKSVSKYGRPVAYGKHSVIYLDITEFKNSKIILEINKFISIADILNGNENVVSDDDDLNQLEKDISAGEKFVIAKQRVGQEAWKRKLKKKFGGKCAICDIELNDMLIASHIKPWSKSNEREKVDVHNGLILCPNHDKLFDRNLISFDENGDIIIAKKIAELDVVLNISKKRVSEKYYKKGTYELIYEYMKEHKIAK